MTVSSNNPSAFNDTQSRADFFQQRLEHLLTYWRDHEAVAELQIAVLDRERTVILKVIGLGLDIKPLWCIVRPLIISLTPYMERRGHWEEWYGVLERAISVAQQKNDTDHEVTLTALLARLCQRMSRPQDVVKHYRRVIRLARRTGNHFEEARACSNLGYHYIDSDRWWRGEILSKYALEVFEELGSEHGRAHTHNHLGILFVLKQNWNDAKFHLLKACEFWTAMKDEHSLGRALVNLALLHNGMRQPEIALGYLQQAEAFLKETGETSEIATIWSNMAEAFRLNGNLNDAFEFAYKAETIYRRNMNMLALARVWHNLGLIHLENGRTSQAKYYRDETLKIYRQFDYQVGKSRLFEDYKGISSDMN